MSKTIILSKAELARRAACVREVNARTDFRGLTRPARSADKREILARRGGLGPFTEGSAPRPTALPAQPSRRSR